MKKTAFTAAMLIILTSCGSNQPAAEEQKMVYIKTAVMFDTLTDMYNNPEEYLGKQYHMSGTLYPYTDNNGNVFYSVYTEDQSSGHGIGLELDWEDFSSFEDYETVTVEGILEKTSIESDGNQQEYLILHVSSIEKRENK
ncbi:MAG: hypothetical protein MJ071_08280 [Oscillospiraceae bacterium]|nr:hypothetical protein [Oscillospiraceae bacterium]